MMFGHSNLKGTTVKTRCTLPAILLALAALAHADGPVDNHPDKVRPIPPQGIVLAAAHRSELESGVGELAQTIDSLRKDLKSKPALLELLPDVQIYSQRRPLRPGLQRVLQRHARSPMARTLLEQGTERARQLREGKAPWTTATGLVVRGYVSKIDGSVQPYGLVVPASYQPNTPHQLSARLLVPRPRRNAERS